MDQTSLYRLLDADGTLLYVGIAGNPGRRFSQHEAKPWWSEVSTTTIEHYETRDAACEAERLAIKTEKPIYNIQYSDGVRPVERTPLYNNPSHSDLLQGLTVEDKVRESRRLQGLPPIVEDPSVLMKIAALTIAVKSA